MVGFCHQPKKNIANVVTKSGSKEKRGNGALEVADTLQAHKKSIPFIQTRKINHELKKDVFNSLKFYRFSIYNLADKMKALTNNQIFKNCHYSFMKILNEGAN